MAYSSHSSPSASLIVLPRSSAHSSPSAGSMGRSFGSGLGTDVGRSRLVWQQRHHLAPDLLSLPQYMQVQLMLTPA